MSWNLLVIWSDVTLLIGSNIYIKPELGLALYVDLDIYINVNWVKCLFLI